MKFQSLVVSVVASALSLQLHAADSKAKGKTEKAESVSMSVDTMKSQMKWTGTKKVTGSSHNGMIALKSGKVEVTGAQVTGGEFEVDMNSITDEDLKTSPEDMNKLVGHLKSDDFFGVEKYPTANFKIKSVKPVAGKTNVYDVAGSLTIKGKSENVTFPAEITVANGEATAKAQFEIDRTLWGLKYGSGKFFKSLGDKVISDMMKFELNLVAKK